MTSIYVIVYILANCYKVICIKKATPRIVQPFTFPYLNFMNHPGLLPREIQKGNKGKEPNTSQLVYNNNNNLCPTESPFRIDYKILKNTNIAIVYLCFLNLLAEHYSTLPLASFY